MIIEILKSGPKVREDISKILNKTVGRIAFTRYIVEWRLEQKPEMFVKDENGLWNLKTCEVLA